MRGREAGALGFGDWGPPKGETASEKGKALFVSRRLHQGGMNWVEGSPPSPPALSPRRGCGSGALRLFEQYRGKSSGRYLGTA